MKRAFKNSTKNQEEEAQNEFFDKTNAKPGKLCEKQYSERSSLLTELYQNKHLATVYHLFLVILFCLFINTSVNDYVYKGEIKRGFDLIFKGFAKPHLVILTWTGMFLASLVYYYVFKFWATTRIQLIPKLRPMLDNAMVIAIILFYACFMYFPILTINRLQLPIVASFALLTDNVRFMMVLYAFVRSNAPRVLNYEKDQKILCPCLSKFLYFSFAPTLIYKDDYPRSKCIEWKKALVYALEFCGGVLLMSFIVENFQIHSFHDYGLRHYSWQELTMIFLKNAASGLLFSFTTFYVILHTWMNLSAEILRFSDRNFYKDWWTSKSYSRYYRTWNVVVHDWLYAYIYKDFYEHVYSKSKTPARLLVFVISAIYHEYVLAFAFGFFLPIMFIEFVFIGVPVMFLEIGWNCLGNTLFLYYFGLGAGIIMNTYSMEYYARVNCPVEDPTVLSYFIPQLFYCNK